MSSDAKEPTEAQRMNFIADGLRDIRLEVEAIGMAAERLTAEANALCARTDKVGKVAESLVCDLAGIRHDLMDVLESDDD